MSTIHIPSAAPDLSKFMNYEYEVDLNGKSGPAQVIGMVGENKRVLEVGAGSGAISRKLVEVKNCEVVALEINPVSVEKLKAFCKKVYSLDLNDHSWTTALAEEEKFDVIIAADVLEHLYDPWTVLKEMKTLLRDDGFIVLCLPHAGYCGVLSALAQEDFSYAEWGLLDKTHIRFFGIHNIQTLLADAGLAVEQVGFFELRPSHSEFGERWRALSETERHAFSSHKFSYVYQVVTKSVPVERAAKPIALIDTQPKMSSELDDGHIQMIAFYLPQFHPIPENDLWWGRGFTEWTNVTKAKPLFPGHSHPHLPTELGFYDLRLRETRHDQIELAKAYGIDGFCYHYYWFSGRRLLNAPLDDMLADPDSDMPFCLCWANENWTRRWDAAEHEILIAQEYRPNDDLDFIKDLVPFLQDKRYIRLNGAPFFIVYRPQHLPDAKKTVTIWREYCASIGIPEIHIACAFTHGNWDYKQYGFDSGVEFPPHNMVKACMSPDMQFHDEFTGYIFDYADVAELYLSRNYSADYNGFRGVFPSWDNTARRGQMATVGLNGTPQNYEFWLAEAIAKTRQDFPDQDRLVFINAWNEWAEGCHLEPCREYGRQFLEATARARAGKSKLSGFVDRGVPAVALAPPPEPEPEPELLPVPTPQPVRVKEYSKLGLFLRKKVRTPVRAALRRIAGMPPKNS